MEIGRRADRHVRGWLFHYRCFIIGPEKDFIEFAALDRTFEGADFMLDFDRDRVDPATGIQPT